VNVSVNTCRVYHSLCPNEFRSRDVFSTCVSVYFPSRARLAHQGDHTLCPALADEVDGAPHRVPVDAPVLRVGVQKDRVCTLPLGQKFISTSRSPTVILAFAHAASSASAVHHLLILKPLHGPERGPVTSRPAPTGRGQAGSASSTRSPPVWTASAPSMCTPFPPSRTSTPPGGDSRGTRRARRSPAPTEAHLWLGGSGPHRCELDGDGAAQTS
jgi:hypothetical protein